jgi:hypothetical protein
MFSAVRTLKQLHLHQLIIPRSKFLTDISRITMANNDIELLQDVDTIQKNYLKETCIQVNEQDEPIGNLIM